MHMRIARPRRYNSGSSTIPTPRAAVSGREGGQYSSASMTVRTRVGAAATARLLLLRRQPGIGFDPVGGGGANPGLRSREGRDVDLTGLHVQPRLAVGDMSAIGP